MIKLPQIANQVTATMALVGVAWGAFIYINDVRYMAGNIAVRNIGWAIKEICERDKDNEMMREYLAAEFQRYERYTGRVHTLAGKQNVCE